MLLVNIYLLPGAWKASHFRHSCLGQETSQLCDEATKTLPKWKAHTFTALMIYVFNPPVWRAGEEHWEWVTYLLRGKVLLPQHLALLLNNQNYSHNFPPTVCFFQERTVWFDLTIHSSESLDYNSLRRYSWVSSECLQYQCSGDGSRKTKSSRLAWAT